MAAQITLFPVGNGDMTLIELDSGRTVLIDANIRSAADDPDDDTPDVAAMLRDRLKRDSSDRLCLDAFLLSHPDQDHCAGLRKHFHLGRPEDWSPSDDKIFVREIWSSPMVFRRASSNHTLCDDAAAFNCEARRRVKRFRDTGGLPEGDRILILGEDENGKSSDLSSILVRVDQEFTTVNGQNDSSMSARLLAPQPKSDNQDEERTRSKNHSSTIIRFSLSGEGQVDACRFLTGGDAEVAIWERLWQRHSMHPDWLSYDILLAPHHCSWHSLSYDSWSQEGEKAETSRDARYALSQARDGAVIVASSKAIKDDDSDPPCIRAKREYASIAKEVRGEFECVGEPASRPDTIEFEIVKEGPRRKMKPLTSAFVFGSGAVGRQPHGHG